MRLVTAPLNYSSWSTRAWLALDHAGADFKTHEIALFVDPDWRDKVLQFSGAGKVPILIDGTIYVDPEPSSLVLGLFAAVGLAAVVNRARRRRVARSRH